MNPCPKTYPHKFLRVQTTLYIPSSRRQGVAGAKLNRLTFTTKRRPLRGDGSPCNPNRENPYGFPARGPSGQDGCRITRLRVLCYCCSLIYKDALLTWWTPRPAYYASTSPSKPVRPHKRELSKPPAGWLGDRRYREPVSVAGGRKTTARRVLGNVTALIDSAVSS